MTGIAEIAKLRAYQGFSGFFMNSAAGLLLALIAVAILVYTKPNFFWNTPKMRGARQNLTDAQAEMIGYGMTLVLGVFAIAVMLFS
jgi:uncharacterized membrane protein YidH (DUF202 family)